MKKSEIKFNITLDENNLPEEITWEATDSGINGAIAAKSILLSVWDPNENNTLRIDLWTKDMMVDEMKIFVHQTLLSLANTLERATQEDKMAADLRDFCNHYAEKLDLKKRMSIYQIEIFARKNMLKSHKIQQHPQLRQKHF